MDADYRLQLRRGFEYEGHFIDLFFYITKLYLSLISGEKKKKDWQNVFSGLRAGGKKGRSNGGDPTWMVKDGFCDDELLEGLIYNAALSLSILFEVRH